MTVYRHAANGSGMMAESFVTASGKYHLVSSVTCTFNTAPATSENLTVTLDAVNGSNYDVLLYSVDPAATALTDLVWYPDEPLYLMPGDAVDVDYANTDLRTWHLTITLVGV